MKSASSQRGTSTKKIATTPLNDGDVGNHLSADSNSDENYDDIMSDHFETTYEKSIAPQKRARILGGGTRKQRGTFGVGMKSKASFFNISKATTPTLRKNDDSNKATAALLQQQQCQQENFATGNLYSIGMGVAIENNDEEDDDEANLFDMLNCIPSDLRPNQKSNNKPTSSSQHHQRSESGVPAIPSRSPFRLVRSSTYVPQRPKFFRRIQRSHSMALNHNIDDTNSDFWDENTTNPDSGGLDAIERTMMHGPPKTRKIIRAPRRHSWIPHSDMIRSTSVTTSNTTSSGSMSSTNILYGSMTSFPDVNDNLDVGAVNSSRPRIFTSLSQTNFSNMSPEPRSETSTSTGCRKRGVSTSSVSDIEECIQLSGGSLSSKRRNQSSEQLLRIFSIPPGQQMPPAPCLDYYDDEYNASDFSTSFGRHHHESNVSYKRAQKEVKNDKNARLGLLEHVESMDQDTSIEDAPSQKNSSPDSSFEAVDDDDAIPNKLPPVNAVVEESVDTKIERVLETMPSIDDLTFLINELKDEERRSHRVIVGAGEMWKIAPPLQQWTSQRRTVFIHWAKVSLGFIVRSAGMGYMFVQIHKKRGLQLVELLEHAKIKYMASNLPDANAVQQCSNQLLFTNNFQHRTKPVDEQQNSASRPPVNHLAPTFTMTDTDVLAEKLSTLAMASKSKKANLAAENCQNHTVTLPMISDENIAIQRGDGGKCQRLSIDQMGAGSKASRPSFDSHTQSVELSQHLLGHSPRMSVGRPPKGTIISYRCSLEGAENGGGNTRNSRTPNVDNLCFVTTPLMAKDRGWGSRPIGGQDWGTSASCESIALNELIIRFERSLSLNGLIPSSGEYHLPLVSLSQLDFDLEADEDNERNIEADVGSASMLALKNADRLYRKRVSKYNKMKRMSLFAVAVNSQLNLPLRQSKCIDQIEEIDENSSAAEFCSQNEKVVASILSFLNESELMTKAFPVCKAWSDYATVTHTKLLVASIQGDEADSIPRSGCVPGQEPILEISWKSLHRRFPWACFLAEGGAKKVHKVYNSSVNAEEALSVMDTHRIDNVQIVANELAVSAMVSSLVRRGVCPNFVAMHKVFTCAYAPPEVTWGCETNKAPNGVKYDEIRAFSTPKEPKCRVPGRYQYIQMELANEGDAEELIKRQHNEVFPTDTARMILFQVSYALFAASEKFSIKHYDVKLLNVFIQHTCSVGDLILRYGLGSHVFALKMTSNLAFIAKLADFGTSNMAASTNGLPVTISHFTTLENTPPDYLILGDYARQGHSHDNFGLGLVMLHLFTGFRPYEEILEDVLCPPNLKEHLQNIWENEKNSGYSVIRSVIFDGVDVDDYGNLEGDPDNTLYDTLYRYLVLFGIPKQKFQEKNGRLVWNAISDALQGTTSNGKKVPVSKYSARKKAKTDITTFKRDCKKYSIRTGTNIYIARARHALTVMEGGLDLLFRLCNFDPTVRATAMDVLNSKFMDSLREQPGWLGRQYDCSADVRSFLSFSTTKE